MPRLHSSRFIIKVLEGNGFRFVSQKGSHAKFYSVARNATVVVPINKKEIPMGTFISIVRQSKLERTDFES